MSSTYYINIYCSTAAAAASPFFSVLLYTRKEEKKKDDDDDDASRRRNAQARATNTRRTANDPRCGGERVAAIVAAIDFHRPECSLSLLLCPSKIPCRLPASLLLRLLLLPLLCIPYIFHED